MPMSVCIYSMTSSVDARLERRLIPIERYNHFDLDGWSEDMLMGMRIDRDGVIRDARLGCLSKDDGTFYDDDGNGFPATHLLMLKMGDLHLTKTRLSLKKNVLWTPSGEQLKALNKASHMLPWEKELKTLLKDLKQIL